MRWKYGFATFPCTPEADTRRNGWLCGSRTTSGVALGLATIICSLTVVRTWTTIRGSAGVTARIVGTSVGSPPWAYAVPHPNTAAAIAAAVPVARVRAQVTGPDGPG